MERREIPAGSGSVAVAYHAPAAEIAGLPLLVALHGGTYTSGYFSVAGGPAGSFLDIAARNGFAVLTVDRPGYGESTLLPEDENTFARQAEILDGVIAEALTVWPAAGVVLVGHSIGGMIGLEIAARHPQWPLLGVTTSGNGARIPAGGAAEALGSLPLSGVVDLPVPERDGVMFGPAGTFTEAAREAAHGSYAPTPFVELVRAPVWARERLSTVAAAVEVPVLTVLAAHDALWDSSAEARADYESRFTGPVTAPVLPGTGHSVDHHLMGAALDLMQLGFAQECLALRGQAAPVA
ncbi:MAG TPA: alpha/beta hydrolase family protein [Trebonia sp.]|jgi:pimeloyl-ACP methyl ester carboxylesterase|nr:alpha/beta hydrolase family protein [Trebonia sp.]